LKLSLSKGSTGKAARFEGFADLAEIAPLGGFTNQSPCAPPDAL